MLATGALEIWSKGTITIEHDSTSVTQQLDGVVHEKLLESIGELILAGDMKRLLASRAHIVDA